MFDEAELVEKAEHMLESMNMAGKHHMHAAAMSRGDKRRSRDCHVLGTRAAPAVAR